MNFIIIKNALLNFVKMKFDWNHIEKPFKEKIQPILKNLKTQKNLSFIPYCGKRTLLQQAILWRQGRSSKIINDKINELKKIAPILSKSISDAGVQKNQKKVTNAIPGMSWHNWGLAIDVYLEDNEGKPQWNGSHEGYFILSETLQSEGLRSGYNFKFRDSGHIQYYQKEVNEIFSLEEINEHFKNEIS